MPTLLLVRHGRTAANSAGVLAGRSAGVELDDQGRAQAAAAAERIRGVPLAAAVTSPLVRCRQTAQAVLAEHPTGLRPQVDRALIECGYGDWTGRTLKELAKDPLWRTVQSQPSAVRFPGGESMVEMSARAVTTVRDWNTRLTAEHGADVVWAAFSHGDVIKAILADALGMHLDAFQRIVVNPASVSVVHYNDQQPLVWTMNSTAGDLAPLFHRKPRRSGRGRSGRGRSAGGGSAAVGGGLGTGQD